MADGGKQEPPLTEKEFLEILDHDLRKAIVELINDRVEVTYTDLLAELKVGDGTLNFHLKKLASLLRHTPKGSYILSDNGRLAIKVIQTVRKSIQKPGRQQPLWPSLGIGILSRRIAAFVIDGTVFFIFTGVFFDQVLWNNIEEFTLHLGLLTQGHPWIFHPSHLAAIGQVAFRLVGVYAHVFFAVFIFLTILEAYKGQTPGKYLLGIRVVKINGEKVSLLESAIRNAGKVFLLPLDFLIGLIFYSRRGYIRFFDFYVGATISRVIPSTPGKEG